MSFVRRTKLMGQDNLAIGEPSSETLIGIGTVQPIRVPEAGYRSAAVSVTTLTQSAGVCSCQATSHGFAVGDTIQYYGVDSVLYLYPQKVLSVADANNFTSGPIRASTASPATGTITVRKIIS